MSKEGRSKHGKTANGGTKMRERRSKRQDGDEGEKTAWYIFGIGSIFGVHTAHFHGQLYLRSTSLALKRDVLEIYPGTHETIEMLGYNTGRWLFHCHVSIHAASGMKTSYTVRPRPSGKLTCF